jgi:hypothetical protein
MGFDRVDTKPYSPKQAEEARNARQNVNAYACEGGVVIWDHEKLLCQLYNQQRLGKEFHSNHNGVYQSIVNNISNGLSHNH